MSRTIRAVRFNRHGSTLKWYPLRFKPSDMRILAKGKPPAPASREIRIEVTETYSTYKKVPYTFRCAGTGCIETAERYVDIDVTRTYTKKVRNPAWDEDISDAYEEWLDIHNAVHRNGSCRRQRLHAAKQAKQAVNRHTRRTARYELKLEVMEFLSEL